MEKSGEMKFSVSSKFFSDPHLNAILFAFELCREKERERERKGEREERGERENVAHQPEISLTFSPFCPFMFPSHTRFLLMIRKKMTTEDDRQRDAILRNKTWLLSCKEKNVWKRISEKLCYF